MAKGGGGGGRSASRTPSRGRKGGMASGGDRAAGSVPSMAELDARHEMEMRSLRTSLDNAEMRHQDAIDASIAGYRGYGTDRQYAAAQRAKETTARGVEKARDRIRAKTNAKADLDLAAAIFRKEPTQANKLKYDRAMRAYSKIQPPFGSM